MPPRPPSFSFAVCVREKAIKAGIAMIVKSPIAIRDKDMVAAKSRIRPEPNCPVFWPVMPFKEGVSQDVTGTAGEEHPVWQVPSQMGVAFSETFDSIHDTEPTGIPRLAQRSHQSAEKRPLAGTPV
jgi:hypothetical protein